LKLVFLMWKEVSHVVSFQALSKGCELDKWNWQKRKSYDVWWGVSYPMTHYFVHWECEWSTSAKWTHWTFNGSYKIGRHCFYSSMSKSFL
jgi:hypothetical protein